jgi:hypothetical protein
VSVAPVLKVPPFSSLGIILSYQCSNECRHCLYACSPGWEDWISDETLESLLSEISRNSRFLEGVHIAGGEPFIRPDRLLRAVEAISAAGLPIDTVETNAFWATQEGETEETLLRMKKAGLPAVLVSVSPFHQEFIPLERADRLIRVASRVFGPGGVRVYAEFFLQQLAQADPRFPIPFEDYLETIGLEKASLDIADRYGLVPNGRAPLELGILYARHSASYFEGGTCAAELTSPHHGHIDLYGNVITGLCAGLSVGDGRNLGALASGMDLTARPVLRRLHEGGAGALAAFASSEYGFREDPEGYIAKCHLCLEVRRHLVRSGAEFPELEPKGFYKMLETGNHHESQITK